MRIRNDVAPIAPPTDNRTSDSPAAEGFAALLAAAGALPANAPAPLPNGGAAAATTAATETTATAATGTSSALPNLPSLLVPLANPAPGDATQATTGPAAPTGCGVDPASAATTPPVEVLDVAVTLLSATGDASVTGAPQTDVGEAPGATTQATEARAAGATPTRTEAPPTVTAPPAPDAGVTPTRTDAPTATTAAPATTPPAATSATTAAPPAAAVADEATADAPVVDLRTTAPAAPAAVPSTSATEQPIPPSRFAGVAVAAARASAEADRPVRLSVRLDPPELGEVRIELTARNGVVTVRVEPVHDAAAPLLSQQRAAVSAALERSGFSMAAFDVTPGEQQAQQQAQQSKRASRVAEITATDDPITTDTVTGPAGLRI